MSAAARVLVAGGASLDTLIALERFPEPRPQTVFSRGSREAVGGTGAGKALNLARLGFDTTLHLMLGADPAGERVRTFLEGQGVKLVTAVDPAGTERHVNLMAADGGRISIYVAYATFEPGLDAGALAPALAAAEHLVVNIINAYRPLLPLARALGKPLWCDLHDWDGEEAYHRDFAQAADHLFLSSDRLGDHRALMWRLREAGKRLVVCTHGRRGATALTADGRWLEVPIVDRYPRVDSNGAGDAFFAGYLFGHVRGAPVERCLRLASLVAGRCVASPELADLSLTPEALLAEERAVFGEP